MEQSSLIASCILVSMVFCGACEPDEACDNTFDCDVGESCVNSECIVAEQEELAIDFFRARPTTINEGDRVEVSWRVDGAERCTINGDTVACNGVTEFQPVTTMTFTLRGERGTTSVFRDIEIIVLSGDDAGTNDAGFVDGGFDGGQSDGGGIVDAGQLDAGQLDAGQLDAGQVDAGQVDAGQVDAGQVDAGPPPIKLFANDNAHRCVILNGSDLKCWGANGSGQLGLGDTEARGDAAGEMGANLLVVDVGGAPIKIALGLNHTCALLAGGGVKCWGAMDRVSLAWVMSIRAATDLAKWEIIFPWLI